MRYHRFGLHYITFFWRSKDDFILHRAVIQDQRPCNLRDIGLVFISQGYVPYAPATVYRTKQLLLLLRHVTFLILVVTRYLKLWLNIRKCIVKKYFTPDSGAYQKSNLLLCRDMQVKSLEYHEVALF